MATLWPSVAKQYSFIRRLCGHSHAALHLKVVSISLPPRSLSFLRQFRFSSVFTFFVSYECGACACASWSVALLSHLLIYLNTHKPCTLNASFRRSLALPQSKPPLFGPKKRNEPKKKKKKTTRQSRETY